VTHRPADIPPEVWATLTYGKLERLDRAWTRLYVASVPKAYRRKLWWSASLGPLGMALAVYCGAVLRLIDRRLGAQHG
jgi:hypothetical protein